MVERQGLGRSSARAVGRSHSRRPMTGLRSLPRRRQRVAFSADIPFLSDRCIVAGIAVSVLAEVVLLLRTGLRVEPNWTLAGFALWAAIAVATCRAIRIPATRAQRVTRDLIEGVSLFALVSLLGAIASYPLAVGHHGFVDGELERIDLRLHFQWIRWYTFVATHAWLQVTERLAYLSIFVTPALLIAHFACTGRRADIRLFTATYWVAVLITLALFPLFPAAGPFATLWHGQPPYVPLSALYQDQVIGALRNHSLRSIDLGALHGLVCAPSFHAASAVIYSATALRIAPIRWPMVALNILMLTATPVEGTHYLIDLLGGILVGCFALRLTPMLIRSTIPRASEVAPDFEWAESVAAE